MSKSRRFSARRPISDPPPLADRSPFWEAIPPEEIFRYGKPTDFDRTAESAGWTVARFLITGTAGPEDRQTVVGYVRRGLGAYIVRADGVRLALLVHLPTGFCISRTLDDGLILYVADVLEPHVPWETADIGVVNAGAQTYLPALEASGLRCVRVKIFKQTAIVWVRQGDTAARALGMARSNNGEIR